MVNLPDGELTRLEIDPFDEFPGVGRIVHLHQWDRFASARLEDHLGDEFVGETI